MFEIAGNAAIRSSGREALLVLAYVAMLVLFSAAWRNMAPPAASVMELAPDVASKRTPAPEIPHR